MHGTKFILFFSILLSGLSWPARAQDKYRLQYLFADKDTAIRPESLGLETSFDGIQQCVQYASGLIPLLQSKGYLYASVDSLQFDSTSARAWLFTGGKYRWKSIMVDPAVSRWANLAGLNVSAIRGKPFDYIKMEGWKQKMLRQLENNGYPFASVRLDSLLFSESDVSARLEVETGPVYRIDSIRITGTAHINNYFMQRYLDIQNGSIYKGDKLDQISSRIQELPFLTESKKWDLTMLGTGSTVNLYLESKKSSQVNLLVGFLPDNAQKGGKLLLTGEANVNLRNALGGGETIAANWQQLQVQSPRLNLAFQQPYLFHSPFGFDFNFNLFKKDSSFLNLNFQVGLQYLVSARQSGKIFLQFASTNLLTIDTALIIATRQLPQYLDVGSSNLGVDYQFNNTNYRFNPLRGNELNLIASAGIREIRQNSTIVGLSDKNDPGFDYSSLYDTLKLKSYQFRIKALAAHYFKLGRQSTIRAAAQAGWLQTEDPFKNEIFQIGGYRLLRGFDEESIYATSYLVGTTEFRYLIGRNSFLFTFTDFGWARNNSFTEKEQHTYLGLGLGISFETPAGLFNMAYAVGKRDDAAFNLRQSKIHFGFVSLF
jgi:outer membrane protein assembly factor BamA